MHQCSPPQTLASVYGDFERKSDDRTTDSAYKLKSTSSPKSYSTRNEISTHQPQYRKILSRSMCNLRSERHGQQFTSRSERQQITGNQQERDRHRRRQHNDYDLQLRDDSPDHSEHPFRMRKGAGSDQPKPKSRKRSHKAQHARCESARASTRKRRDDSRGQFDYNYNSSANLGFEANAATRIRSEHRDLDRHVQSPRNRQAQSLQSRRPNRHGTEHESASRKPNRRNCSARTRSQFDYNPNPNAGQSIRRNQNHKPKRVLRHTRSQRHSRSTSRSQHSQHSMGEYVDRAQSQRQRTRDREWHEPELPDRDRDREAESSLIRELRELLTPLHCELSNLRHTTRELQHQVSVLKYLNHLHRLLIRGADIADPRSPRRDTVSANHGIGGAISADTIESIEKRFSPSHPSRGVNQILAESSAMDQFDLQNLQNQQSRPHSGIGNNAALIPRPHSPQPRYSFLSHSVRRQPNPVTSPRVISMEAQRRDKHVLIQNDETTDTDYEDIERVISASHYTQKMEEDGLDLDSKLSKLRLQRLTMELDESQLFDGQLDPIGATTANSTRCNGNVTTADASPPFSPTLTRSVPQSRYKYEHTVL